MTITLPWPPSVNHYYRQWQGRMLISKEGRAYRETVALRLRAQGVTEMWVRLRVHILVYPPDRRRRDLDNMMKALLDSLQHGGAFPDDGAIDDLRIVRMGVDRDGGSVAVIIEEMGK